MDRAPAGDNAEGEGLGPPCSKQDTFCRETECRYYIDWFVMGNCTLRVDREHTYTEMAVIFGMSRQRAEQVTKQAIVHFRKKYQRMYGFRRTRRKENER